MRKLLLLIVLLLLNVAKFLYSQTSFDRPGISDSPFIVKKNFWQMESGFTYTSFQGIQNAIIPSVLVRKAFTDFAEFRLCFNYDPQMIGILKRDLKMNVDEIAMGIKTRLKKENGWIPETSFLVNTYYPLQKLYCLSKSGIYNLEAGFQFQYTLSKRFEINYNLGSAISDYFNKGIMSFAFCVNLNLTKKLGLFAESFGYMPLGVSKSEWGYDGGFVVLLKDNAQFDLSIINNRYSTVDYGSIMIGYSIAVSKK